MVRFPGLLLLQSSLWALIRAAETTSASSQPPPPGTCMPDCSYRLPSNKMMVWKTFTPTSTIVAATVRVTINNSTNVTSTTTILNTLPAGVELPPTNEAGTRVAVMTSYAATGGVVTVAYPSLWGDYDSLVSWDGTLSTKGACTTATGAMITLPPHPPIPSSELYWRQNLTTDPMDPKGLWYTPTFISLLPDVRKYATVVDEMALTSCGYYELSPLVALKGVRFLTETETSWDTGFGLEKTKGPESTSPSTRKSSAIDFAPSTAVPVQNPISSFGSPVNSGERLELKPTDSSIIANGIPTKSSSDDSNERPDDPTFAPPVLAPKTSAILTIGFSIITTAVRGPVPKSMDSNERTDAPTSAAPIAVAPKTSAIMTIGSSITAAVGDYIIVVGSQTLTPGRSITVDGTQVVELNPTAPVVTINGESLTFTASQTPKNSEASLTISETPAEFTGGAQSLGISPGMSIVLGLGVAILQQCLPWN